MNWQRLFGLDAQLLFDTVILAVNVFLLFVILSYILFNPVRDMLNKRQDKIAGDLANADKQSKEADALKKEYEEKLMQADKEIEVMLSEARKKALKNQEIIIREAKEEAFLIMKRGTLEAGLEKKKAADELKKDFINVATQMAEKMIDVSIDSETQNRLLYETLEEIGDETWLN